MTHVFRGGVTARNALVALALAGAALLVLAVPQPAEGKPRNVKAMSLNLYFGADVEGALVAPNAAALEMAAGAAYDQILASDPEKRLREQAKIIKKEKPHVVGLQEAPNLFTGPKDGELTAASDKVFDFIKILRDELRKRGVPYRLASKQKNIDVEVPTDKGIDVRLVDRDAILVRRTGNAKVQKTSGDNFETALSAPIPLDNPVPTIVQRGYTQANVKIRGKKLNVVNTHLEAFLASIRDPQAAELVKNGGPTDSRRPTILLGDINSGPNSGSPEAYQAILDSGLRNRSTGRNTCCYDSDLQGGTLTSLIDFVFGSKGVKKRSSFRTGVGSSPPSDHAGVISKLRVR